MCGGVLLFVVALNLAGRGGIGVGLTDPDLAAVRLYLRDNLDSGQWEEIRWWPKRAVPKLPEIPAVTRYWVGEKVCRLKFRTKQRIQTLVFTIENGKAKQAFCPILISREPDSNYKYIWRGYFPNECDDDE